MSEAPRNKIYIIRKFVVAVNLSEALKKDKETLPDECYLEDTSLKQLSEDLLDKDK